MSGCPTSPRVRWDHLIVFLGLYVLSLVFVDIPLSWLFQMSAAWTSICMCVAVQLRNDLVCRSSSPASWCASCTHAHVLWRLSLVVCGRLVSIPLTCARSSAAAGPLFNVNPHSVIDYVACSQCGKGFCLCCSASPCQSAGPVVQILL